MKILLDTNIWRYVVDADAVPALRKAVRKSRHRIVVPPAVLYEAAQTRDAALRDALLAAIADRTWKRLMPEAYSMAEEFKSEVRRLRIDWLHKRPSLQAFKRLRQDWVRSRLGAWDRVLDDPGVLQPHYSETRQTARNQAYLHRQHARSWPSKLGTAPLAEILGAPASSQPGWNGQPVEAWRLDAQNVFSQALKTPGHPTFDWIEGEVNVELMLSKSASYMKFWLHDVDLLQMRRHWLWWAFEFLQRQHRITDGTPVDAQLGSYLVEADLMLTADKLLANIAERCRGDAPFGMAESRFVAPAEAVHTVIDILKES